MSAADRLRESLLRALLPGVHTAPFIVTDPELLARLATRRPSALAPRGHRSLQRIARGVLAFRLHGEKTALPDLKYACYGLARPVDWEGRLLIDDSALYRRLLATADSVGQQRPRAFRDCYRGLLTAWLEDLLPNPDQAAHRDSLLAYLTSRLPVLLRHPRHQAWMTTLARQGLPSSPAEARLLVRQLERQRPPPPAAGVAPGERDTPGLFAGGEQILEQGGEKHLGIDRL